MTDLYRRLEKRQVPIYLSTAMAAAVFALAVPGARFLEAAINPALALMLFATFLQVPLAELGRALRCVRFLAALVVTNFLLLPLLVAVLIQALPPDPMLHLGVLFVLLTPCIDYVVTFSHLGRADARLLLAATPVLLILQIVLLPLYLRFFLGAEVAALVQIGPFLRAFLWLIAAPFIAAAVVQLCSGRNRTGEGLSRAFGALPVPATALVLFVVIAAVVPQLGLAAEGALRALPLYLAFAIMAPLVGWGVGRFFRLDAAAGRALAFSAATRNSLVVLPLALAVPGAVPLLPAVIVAQTLIELLSQIVYIRCLPKLRGTPANVPRVS